MSMFMHFPSTYIVCTMCVAMRAGGRAWEVVFKVPPEKTEGSLLCVYWPSIIQQKERDGREEWKHRKEGGNERAKLKGHAS